MKRAQADIIGTSFPEFYKGIDNLNNIDSANNLLYRFLRNHFMDFVPVIVGNQDLVLPNKYQSVQIRQIQAMIKVNIVVTTIVATKFFIEIILLITLNFLKIYTK